MGCVQKSEFQIFASKGLRGGNKLEKNYFLFYLSFTSSSSLKVHLQSLKRFQRFEERIQFIQEEDLRMS